MEQAFFALDGAALVPAPHARTPWGDPNVLHGRLIAGLIARAVEQEHSDPDFLCSRLTVDLFKPPPLAPLVIETHVVRDGNRIRVVDSTVTNDGVEIARGSVVMLRHAEQPSGNVWSPPEWSVPLPDEIEPPQPRPRPNAAGGAGAAGAAGGAGDAPRGRRMPIWETRSITRGGMGGTGQKQTWMREARNLVEGETLTPFVRAAVAADYTNPFANSGDEGLQFINADITMYLHRLPVSDWLGFEVSSHRSAEGIAVGHCTMYDTTGSIGHSIMCSVANQRMRRPG